MSLINEYRATEEAIKELQERLKNLAQTFDFNHRVPRQACDPGTAS
jgi:hypothetical protein